MLCLSLFTRRDSLWFWFKIVFNIGYVPKAALNRYEKELFVEFLDNTDIRNEISL